MARKSSGSLSYEIESENRKLIVRGFWDFEDVFVDIYDPKDEKRATLTLDWDEAHALKKILSKIIKEA